MAAEDAKQQKQDELEDVTKRTGGAAMASFYCNMNRNVAMGGTTNEREDGDTKKETKKSDEPRENSDKETSSSGLGFLAGFERAPGGSDDKEDTIVDNSEAKTGARPSNEAEEEAPLDPVARNLAMRKAREEKLAKARERYFERNGLVAQTAS